MECRLNSPLVLKLVADILDDMVKEVKLDCGPEGMHLQCMDAASINLISVKMKETFFEYYTCQNAMRLGLDVKTLKKVMAMSVNNDTVSMSCGTEGDKQNCVTFEFEDPAGDHTADFEMRLQEVDNEELGLPDMAEYEYEVRMPSKMLRDIVSNMKEIGDSLEMTFLANKVVFKAIGEFGEGLQEVNDNNKSVENEKNKITCTKTKENDDPVQNVYSIRYMNLLAKDAVHLNPFVTITAASGKPVCMEYELGRAKAGHLKFFIAPKTADDN